MRAMRQSALFVLLLSLGLVPFSVARAGGADRHWKDDPISPSLIYIPGHGKPPVFAPSHAPKNDRPEAQPISAAPVSPEQRPAPVSAPPAPAAKPKEDVRDRIFAAEKEEAQKAAQAEQAHINKTFKVFNDALDATR